jgi:hypothetical protein
MKWTWVENVIRLRRLVGWRWWMTQIIILQTLDVYVYERGKNYPRFAICGKWWKYAYIHLPFWAGSGYLSFSINLLPWREWTKY